MAPLIIALIIMIGFGIWLLTYFSNLIVELLINIPILWIVLLRSYTEIFKEKKHGFYAWPASILLMLFLILKNPINYFLEGKALWIITLYLALVFISAQIFIYAYPRVSPVIEKIRYRAYFNFKRKF